MTDYTKLIEALRCCIPYPPEKCVGCTYNIGNNECAVRRMMLDAADAIKKLVTLYEKTEMDATNLTGKLAQAEADVERLNLEIDKRIATEIELSNQVDALQAEVERLKDSNGWARIVRCKDCKWSISCWYISLRSYAEWKDWFCADGERREG